MCIYYSLYYVLCQMLINFDIKILNGRYICFVSLEQFYFLLQQLWFKTLLLWSWGCCCFFTEEHFCFVHDIKLSRKPKKPCVYRKLHV